MTKEDRAAASELVAYWREYPHCGPGGGFYTRRNNWNAKQHVKEVLGIRRLGTKRFAPILALANQLYLDQVEKPAPSVPSVPQAPQRPARPHNAPSMGLLLSTELRDASTAHAQAAALFCHCPHCGEALRINASVTKGGE